MTSKYNECNCLSNCSFPNINLEPPYLTSMLQNAGNIHNNLLTAYGVEFPDLSGTHQEIWNFMMTGTTKELSQIGITGVKYLPYTTANNYAINIKASLNLYLSESVNEGLITPNIADQTNILLALIKNINDDSDINFRITSYANQMSFNQDFSFNDKTILIGAAFVGQYSNNFWNYALKTTTNPYHQIALNLNETGNLYKIKWADLIGFVIGAAAGASAGPVVAVSTGISLATFASKLFGE